MFSISRGERPIENQGRLPYFPLFKFVSLRLDKKGDRPLAGFMGLCDSFGLFGLE
jgi:hypothetical protein